METKKITELIIKAAYQVHDEMGTGFAEKVYENSLMIALSELNLPSQQQLPLKVYFRDREVGDYYADIVVLDAVIVELKTVKGLQAEHQAQVINYLSATKMQTGLLINFAKKGLEIKRLYSRA